MQTSSDKTTFEQESEPTLKFDEAFNGPQALLSLKFGEAFIKPLTLPSSVAWPKTLTFGDNFNRDSKKEDSESDD
jgi:hypothetical protein